MIVDIFLLAAGFALLLAGGEGLLRGAVSMAARFGMPAFLIGVTVVGFGTSLPEMLVSIQATLSGSPDIAIGNVVGSNIANILLILGVSGVISPIITDVQGLKRDVLVMLAVAFLLGAIGLGGMVTGLMGVIMLLLLVVYLTTVTIADRRRMKIEAEGKSEAECEAEQIHRLPLWKEVIALVLGMAGLFFGADMLIKGATGLARVAGVSEAVIGLTLVAIGTSLPELATAIIAAVKKHAEVALGNVVGSNIFNVLVILGVTALIKPVEISHRLAIMDIPFMIVVSIGLAVMIFLKPQIGRVTAGLMLTLYASYTILLYANGALAH